MDIENSQELKKTTESDTSLSYAWIENEGLLRDEGVLFGIAGAKIEDKLEAINKYYLIKESGISRELERFQKAIDSKKQKIENLQEENLILDGRTEVLKPTGFLFSSKFLPVLFQLIIYLAICYFNFFFAQKWLSPIYQDKDVVSLGLYLFGIFNVFFGRALMYNSDKVAQLCDGQEQTREKWKVYFEEFGIPLVTATLFVVLGFRYYPIEYSIAVWVFFFVFFLFAGKGLINSSYLLWDEVKQIVLGLDDNITVKRTKKALGGKIAANEENSNKSQKEMDELEDDLLKQIQRKEVLNGEREYKCNLFSSEFSLALQARQQNGDLTKFN